MSRAALISIGSELVTGRTVDTNASWLQRFLLERGIETAFVVVVPDNRQAILRALDVAAREGSLVLTTGGLGPTEDDLTRDAVAQWLGKPLVEHAGTLEQIRARFSGRGGMPPSNCRQALIPQGAEILENPLGTAPGFWAEKGGVSLASFPGVPFEMVRMAEDVFWPRLERSGVARRTVRVHRLMTFGWSESRVDEAIAPIFADGSVSLTTGAGKDGLSLTLLAGGEESDAVERLLAVKLQAVRDTLGSIIFADGQATLEEVVKGLLEARGVTLGLAESCTGGRAAALLTRLPGSSRVFAGSVVAYSNRAKSEFLGVPEELIARHGAVSAEVAEALAKGARTRFGASLGAGITGVAGPDGGSEEKPVGLVYLSVTDADGVWARRRRYPGDRTLVQRFASIGILDLIRRRIQGLPPDPSTRPS